MPERVEATVAGVLNRRELVLNKGSSDGLEIGMRFAILNRKGVNVKDPSTGEALGSVDVVKAIVKIVRLEPRLAVGRTFRSIKGTPGAFTSLNMPKLLGTPTTVETLSTQEATFKEELDESESYIKRGDPAVLTRGDEYDDDA